MAAAAAEVQHDERGSMETTAPLPPPHVLVFPFPSQGHIAPMLNLAELFSLAGIRVTFLNTDYNHRRLFCLAGIGTGLAYRPGLHFRSISDGLPEETPRTADRLSEWGKSFHTTAAPLFRELLASLREGAPPVTCVVADGIIRFAVDVAEELGVPIIAFQAFSASCVWAYRCVRNLIATGTIPFQDGCNMDELVSCVPGMENFLRRRDLPSYYRTKDVDDPAIQFLKGLIQNATRYQGCVLNTTEFAESSILTHIHVEHPSIYPIGPVHGLLRIVDSKNAMGIDATAASSNSASLWHEERDCMEWLNTKPPASVIYVSFGSMALLKMDQVMEFLHGLDNSGYSFLWVARPDLIVDKKSEGSVPGEVAEVVKERGFLVGWAPQQQVLAHPAVGCFLTHGGWNSTLESMWAGVPMVCWPYFADQQINSRFISEVWGIGIDIKDTCDRVTVEKAVRTLMAGKDSTKMREAVANMSKMMRLSVVEGGTSYMNLERLITDIRSLSLQTDK